MQKNKADRAATFIYLLFKAAATIVVIIFSVYGFCGCSVGEMSGLKDFTKSFCGTYECKKAVLGETNLLDDFEYIRLELKTDGSACFYYKPFGGKKVEKEGEYKLTEEENEIMLCFTALGKRYCKKIKTSGGEIDIVQNYGNRQMLIIFELT